jgi:HAD superfamily hydrolase (TIGR01549 family)
VILDVDGTLVDSNELHAKAWQESFAYFGKELEMDQIMVHIGKGGDLLVPDLLNAREMQEFARELKEYRKNLFRERYLDSVRPFPGISETLRRLREKDLRLILATSSDPPEVKHFIELLGIEELIEGATSKDDAEFSKPSPEIFQAALERLGTKPEETIVVGDTPYDVLAAHRASLPIAAVLCGGFDRESLESAEFIFDDVGGLLERFDEISAYFSS